MEGAPEMPRFHPGTPQNRGVSILARVGDGDDSARRRRRDSERSRERGQAAAWSYWELFSQKSSSALMTSDGRKRRAGVYRRREARRGQRAPLMG